MGLFEWGEKRFARGIARAMIRSYTLHKKANLNLSEFELIKKTLTDRPGKPAKKLLIDIENESFYKSTGGSLVEIIYVLVRIEYVEYMNGTLDEEDKKTNSIFKEVILEEIKNNPTTR